MPSEKESSKRRELKKEVIAFFERHEGKYTAVEVAEALEYPVQDGQAFYRTCPSVRRVLTQLCKEGLLYQWVIGTGMSPLTDRICPYEVSYLKRDSELAGELLKSRGNLLKGYRFK
jgi:hypothetical protein